MQGSEGFFFQFFIALWFMLFIKQAYWALIGQLYILKYIFTNTQKNTN